MPLTKSPKDVSSENHDFTLSVYIFSSNFYFSTFNSLSIHLVPSRIVISLVMSEEAFTIKRNITMILHICGKEDP